MLDYARSIDKEISPKLRAEWSKGTPEQWANESHRIAVETAYVDVAKDGKPQTLSREYVTRGQKAVELQLKRGGVRLAMLLNSAFADEPASTAE